MRVLKVNITLRVGQVAQQVVVNAAAALVHTDSPSLSQVIDQARMNGSRSMAVYRRNSSCCRELQMINASQIQRFDRHKRLFHFRQYFVAGGEANGTNYCSTARSIHLLERESSVAISGCSSGIQRGHQLHSRHVTASMLEPSVIR